MSILRSFSICCVLGGGLVTAYLTNVETMPSLACDGLSKAIANTYPMWRDNAGSVAPRIINWVTVRCPGAEASIVAQVRAMRDQYQIPLQAPRRSSSAP